MGSMSAQTSNSHPRVGLGVFVFKSPTDKQFPLDTWSLPGGHLEHGETFEQCATREVLEETGLEIENVEFLTAIGTMFEAEEKHYITIFMTALAKANQNGDIPDPKVLEPEKCGGWRWISFREMRELDNAQALNLFEPMRNLMLQRPSVCATLERADLL